MVRVPLEELVLQIHLLALGKAGSFLARVLQVWWGVPGTRPASGACLGHAVPARLPRRLPATSST